MDKDELKEKYHKNGHWQKGQIKEDFQGYIQAFHTFNEAFGHVGILGEDVMKDRGLQKYERDILLYLKSKTVYVKHSPLFFFLSKMKLRDDADRDDLLMAFVDIHAKYMDVSLGDFIVNLTKIIDFKVTSRTLKDLQEKRKKLEIEDAKGKKG